jgi:hypothetical protein
MERGTLMPTLTVNGRRVKVDDSFLNLSPEEQEKVVDEIAGSLDRREGTSSGVSPDAMAPNMFEPQDNRGLFRRADDAMRGVADTASYGFSDEASAGMGALTGIGGNRGDYTGNLAAQRARDSEGGWERLGGQVAGAFLNPAGGAKTLLGAALQGAGHGAAYGFGSGEGNVVDRLDDMAVGAGVGGAAGALVRSAANAFQKRAVRKMIPGNEQLKTWKNAAYKQSEQAGDIIGQAEIAALRKKVVDDLADHGFHPNNEPGVVAALTELNRLQGQSSTLKGIDVLRKMASNGYVAGNKSNNALVSKIIDRIDEATDNLAGSPALHRGRDYARRLAKSEGVDTAQYRAELRAASTGSGGNADNATRQNIRRMLEKPRGMTKTEQAAAERVVRGTKAQNALRLVGKLAPQGNGLMGALGVGGAMINPVLGIPALVGGAAKALADRGTVKNVQRLSEIIRSGGYSSKEIAALARQGKLPLKAVQAIENAEKQFQNKAATIAAMFEHRATSSQ